MIYRCSWPTTLWDVKWLPLALKKLEILKCSYLISFLVCCLNVLEELVFDGCSWPSAFLRCEMAATSTKKASYLPMFWLDLLSTLLALRLRRISDWWMLMVYYILRCEMSIIITEKAWDWQMFRLDLLSTLLAQRLVRTSDLWMLMAYYILRCEMAAISTEKACD